MPYDGHIILPDGGPSPPHEGNHRPAPWLGVRHLFAFLGFLGFVNVYAMRVNLSVAIVAMVNSTDGGNGNSSVHHNGTCPVPIVPANTTNPDNDKNGQFNWDEETQSTVLGAFFYGYVLTQLPGGRLAELVGGKWIFGIGILVTSVFTVLMPIAAKIDFRLLIATRVIEGLGEGVTFPVMHAMLAEWAPPLERSKLAAFIYAGSMIGTVISLPLTGIICDTLGWEAAFYIFGTFGIVWCFFWAFFVSDTPHKHPFISQAEKDLIEISLGKRPLVASLSRSTSVTSANSLVSDLDGSTMCAGDDEQIIPIDETEQGVKLKVPWKSIATSVPFWAIMIAHSCQNWGFYTMLTELPTYMKQILHFNIKENAFLSALPYLCMWLISVSGSHLADFVRSRGYLSTTSTRKVFNSLAFFTPALCLVLLSLAECNKVYVVALLCSTVGINGFSFSSVNVNHIDIAPNFAGTLMGLTNMVANTMGFLAPLAISHIIEGHEDIQHWQTVFYIAAGVYVGGNLLYLLMASGQEQPWNKSMAINVPTEPTDAHIQPATGPILRVTAEELIGEDAY